MTSSSTQAPHPITESELIAKMDTEGIGTDATIAAHIETVVKREYIERCSGGQAFKPSALGLALIDGYAAMGEDAKKLSQPHLRAQMELNCVKISRGEMTKRQAIDMCINTMRPLYEDVVRNARALDAAVGQHFATLGSAAGASRVLARAFSACGHCAGRLALQQSASEGEGGSGGVFLNCAACNEAHPLPRAVEGAANVRALGEPCAKCGFEKLELRTVFAPTGQESVRSICPWCQSYRFGGATARKEMVVPRCEKCKAAAAQLQLGKTKAGGHMCVSARSLRAHHQPPAPANSRAHTCTHAHAPTRPRAHAPTSLRSPSLPHALPLALRLTLLILFFALFRGPHR